jgi:hypothetical protein
MKEELLKRTLEDLAKIYPQGLYEYLYKQRRELYGELLDLEERIDRCVLSESIEDLKAALRDYWKLHTTAIREFKNIDQLSFDLPKAREEMTEERIKA